MKSIKLIYFLITATLALILANTLFFLVQYNNNQLNYAEATKAHNTIEFTNVLQNTLLRAETAQQTFYITGESQSLEPYKSAVTTIEAIYQKAYAQEKTHKTQLVRLKRLHQLISLKLALLNQIIELQKNNRSKEALAIFKSEESNKLIYDTKVLIAQIKTEENNFLQANNTEIDKLSLRIQLFSIVSNWVLLVIIVSALISLINNRNQIKALFAQIGKKNELLEDQKIELQGLSQGLIKKNADLERFAYVASHDLRSPAGNQIALLGLYDAAKSEQERATFIDHMKEVALSLSAKLDGLIEELRNNTSATPDNILTFEEIYRSVASNLHTDIRASQAKIECDFSDAPQIYLNKSYLESIVQNLLSNALKYRHPQRTPEIKLKTFKYGNSICFKISDNGLGIDLEKNATNIFGRYKTFHQNKDSNGLGLYITKSQVVAMGGTIEIDSKPDIGTTFLISINNQAA